MNEKPDMTMAVVHGYLMESDVVERLVDFVEGSCAGVAGACGDGMEASRVGVTALLEGDRWVHNNVKRCNQGAQRVEPLSLAE